MLSCSVFCFAVDDSTRPRSQLPVTGLVGDWPDDLRRGGFLPGPGIIGGDDWGAQPERLQQWADAWENRQANSAQWP